VDNRGAVQAWANGVTEARDTGHLRISQVGIGMFDESELEFAPEPIRLPPPVATSSVPAKQQPPSEQHANRDLEQSYHRSLKSIDDHIYGLAAAITALDGIETQLTQARTQIEQLRARGEPINVRKAETTLLNLAEHINQAVRRIDMHDVNLMRDSRIELRVVELDTDNTRAMGFDLTLISLEKLLAYKLRSSPMEASELCSLVDALQHTVNSNLHILSSLVLMMFASRDYTDDVSRLVLANGLSDDRPPRHQLGHIVERGLGQDLAQHLGSGIAPQSVPPTLRLVQSAPNKMPNSLAAQFEQPISADPWRRSLMTLLERTQSKAAE
jgi:hypothetical protein